MNELERAARDGAYLQLKEAQRKAVMMDAVLLILKRHLSLYGMVISEEYDGTWILMTPTQEGEDMHRFVTLPELITNALPLIRTAKQKYDDHGRPIKSQV